MQVEDKRRKAIKAMILRSTRANAASEEVARAWLVNIGIYTQAGKLSKDYGGSALKAKSSKSKRSA